MARSSTTKKGSSAKKAKGVSKGSVTKGSTTVKTSILGRKEKGSNAKKGPAVTYKIDCSIPAADSIFDADLLKGFQQYLLERIKVRGRTGSLRDNVKVSLDDNNVLVRVYIAFSKRYLKYLTKKYLKKKTLRDWLRVVAVDKTTYELRYFNIHDQDEGDDE